MFMPIPAVRKDSGTSRWLRYDLFLSLSDNNPGVFLLQGRIVWGKRVNPRNRER